METSDAFEKVRVVLEEILKDVGLDQVDIKMESSIITDLGFTSLMLVDLTLALENTFQIEEFPMQEWIDEQALSESGSFEVRALVDKCRELVS